MWYFDFFNSLLFHNGKTLERFGIQIKTLSHEKFDEIRSPYIDALLYFEYDRQFVCIPFASTEETKTPVLLLSETECLL